MQDDNVIQPQSPEQSSLPPETPQFAPVVSPPASSAATPARGLDKTQEYYEYSMLLFGIVTIISLLSGNGPLLKIGVGLFLVVGVISIIRGLNKPRPAAQPESTVMDSTEIARRKKSKVIKVVGLSLMVILLLPVLSYVAMFVFIIFLFTLGGGNMGT